MRGQANDRESDLLLLALLAIVAGAATGLIVAVFRLTLAGASRWRDDLIVQAHQLAHGGFVLVVVGCAAAVAIAA